VEQRQMQMLREIQQLEFAAVELNLFLDTHPRDREPLNDLKTVVDRLHQLKEQYEGMCGPLTVQGFTPESYPWRWVEGPWPWEMVY